MRVIDSINKAIQEKKTAFSFEILPPLKGNDVDKLFNIINPLIEFKPLNINITSHRDEIDFVPAGNGNFAARVTRKRPGTVAAAAAIMNKYNIPVVPHILCAGFSKSETEFALIDLNYLGIHDLLLLKGDSNSKVKYPTQLEKGNEFALDLISQVNDFNNGKFFDGTKVDPFLTKFSYGVAGYPEKHEESPNMDSDLQFLKEKVDAGASYIVTQMFFDNNKYYNFVNKCRSIGINVPIVPGLKPITFQNQLNVLPKIFKSDIPEEFAAELRKCKDDEEVKEVGIEWCTAQAKDLMKNNIPVLHFYTMMALKSVRKVAETIY
jgi:methylenetetrahydrofolate reductase (NADPH)